MTETGARALSWLRNAVLAVFVVALLAGIAVPIYTDEVGWRLQERAAFDGVDKLFSEICGPNSLVHPPFWMMPARYYSALFNSLFADPLYVRISGILYAFAGTAMIFTLVRRLGEGGRDRIALSTIALGFLSLGTLPMLLVLSRPEQPILLALVGAMLITLSDRQGGEGDTPVRAAWLRSLAIVALACVAMSYHVKGVATVPLFLTCLAFATRGQSAHAPRLVLAVVLTGAAFWAAYYWIGRFECPNDPQLRADFEQKAGAALATAAGWSQVLPLLDKLLGNVSLLLYPGITAPRPDPVAYWLPFDQISPRHSFAWFLATVFVWIVAFVGAAYAALLGARRAWRERRIDPRLVLALVLVATVLGWSATGFNAAYEATFTVPMLILAVVLALSAHDGGAVFSKILAVAAAGIGLVGMVSIALVAAIYGPALAASTHERGYLARQPFSISAFGYAGMRREMLAAARKCGIVDPAARHGLVVDDYSYFAFMDSSMPEHRYGVFLPFWSAEQSIDYLRGIRSDGVIASCHALPPAIQARARREGQFCCLAPPGW